MTLAYSEGISATYRREIEQSNSVDALKILAERLRQIADSQLERRLKADRDIEAFTKWVGL